MKLASIIATGLLLLVSQFTSQAIPAWSTTVSSRGVQGPGAAIGDFMFFASGPYIYRYSCAYGWVDTIAEVTISGDDSYIHAMAAKDNYVYIAGKFDNVKKYLFINSVQDMDHFDNTSASNVARFDITTGTWSALGSGVSRLVTAMTIATNGDVYVGRHDGFVSGAWDSTILQKWNGSSWSSPGSGLLVGSGDEPGIEGLANDGTNVYVTGNFIGASNGVSRVTSLNVIKLSGTNWTSMGTSGSGVGTVASDPGDGTTFGYAIAVSGTNVFVAGKFDLPQDGLARFSTAGDSLACSGLVRNSGSAQGYALVENGGEIFVGGPFDHVGATAAKGIAKWDGTSWSALGGGLEFTDGITTSGSYASTLTSCASGVYALGGFNKVNGSSITDYGFNIAKWAKSAEDCDPNLVVQSTALSSGSYSFLVGKGRGNYTVEYVDDLNNNNWTEISPQPNFLGDAQSVTISFSTSLKSRFFRVSSGSGTYQYPNVFGFMYVDAVAGTNNFTLISNPLQNPSGNHISTLFNQISGTMYFSFWTNGAWSTYTRSGGTWSPSDLPFEPGAGGSIQIASATSVGFMGEAVPAGFRTISGGQMVSATVPRSGTPANLSISMSNFGNIYKWNTGNQIYDIYTLFFGSWNPSTPTIYPGVTTYINNGTSFTWDDSYTPW